ncbi:hypothetical protein I3843_01G240600 [Carya illinoinensis]|nr:hypothetical protein I3843_01G240600 [Carya illinoinensis]
MEGGSSQLLLNICEESDSEEREQDEWMARRVTEEYGDEVDDMAEKFQCLVLHKNGKAKRGEDLSWEKHSLWRQELKNRAARLEKQLKTRWELEELIEEQLNRFRAHYNRATVPTRLKDVAQLLMPNWAPPQELASLTWLGDWRPSAMLDLVRGLARSSLSSSLLSDSVGNEKLLSQLIHDARIEEAVLDEEMAEIQATCILHISFTPMSNRSIGSALECILSEFKKIERVITKAQNLRFKALELVVKKVLSKTDAAEFLVAFEGIQDAIHQLAANQRLRKGPVAVSVKALGCS